MREQLENRKVLLTDGTFKNINDLQIGEELATIGKKPCKVIGFKEDVSDYAYSISISKIKREILMPPWQVISLQDKRTEEFYTINLDTVWKYDPHRYHLLGNGAIDCFTPTENDIVKTKDDFYIAALLLTNCTARATIRVTIAPQQYDFVKQWCDMHDLDLKSFRKIYGKNNNSYNVSKKVISKKKHVLHYMAKEIEVADVNVPDRRIVEFIKTASLENRLNFLACVLDTSATCNEFGYVLEKRSEKLVNDLQFMVRSCGFSAYKSVSIKLGKPMYRLIISCDKNDFDCLTHKDDYFRTNAESLGKYTMQMKKVQLDSPQKMRTIIVDGTGRYFDNQLLVLDGLDK